MLKTDERESLLATAFFMAAGVFMGVFLGLALERYLDAIGVW
jgi:hypothetical protein